MATRIKARSDDLHERDLYAWSRAQADLLRAGRFAEPDLERLIDEIEDAGGALKRAVRNHIRTIVERRLKLEHSPATDPRAGGRATVRQSGSGCATRLARPCAAKPRPSWPSSTAMRAGPGRGCAA